MRMSVYDREQNKKKKKKTFKRFNYSIVVMTWQNII